MRKEQNIFWWLLLLKANWFFFFFKPNGYPEKDGLDSCILSLEMIGYYESNL